MKLVEFEGAIYSVKESVYDNILQKQSAYHAEKNKRLKRKRRAEYRTELYNMCTSSRLKLFIDDSFMMPY